MSMMNLSESTLLRLLLLPLPTAAEGWIHSERIRMRILASRDHRRDMGSLARLTHTVVLEVDFYHHYMHASSLRYGCFDQDE
jgi:hypothetical protein